jgi:transcriptional regulator GlxA family with amidase domain
MARAFKERTGYTIGEYQLKSKLTHAQQLLINSRLSVTEISMATGFFDTAHFIRTFVAVFGFTPRKFRLMINS